MTENNNIPKHWQIKKLGEVCLTTSGGTPSRSQSKYYEGNIPWVKSGELDKGLIIETEEKITEEAIKNSSAKVFPKGTLLIALYGATIGKLAFLGVDAATNQAVCGIYKNENIDSDYLFHFLFFKKPSLVKQSIGGAQPNISQGILKNLQIPFPPIPEQQAIVSKIEELLSELENGKQQLITAQQQLKVYRQSLLKWAFEGRLTNKNVNRELSKGWKWIKFNDFCKLQRGYDLPLAKIEKGEYPVITSAGLNGYHNEFRANGPCLTTGRSGGVGNIHYLEVDKYWPHNTVLFVKDFCGNKPKFIYYFFKQFNFKSFSASTAVPTLDRKQLFHELVLVPPPHEQQLIVNELESKLTVCDKIEETISQSLQQAETLRQSILKKAFEGRLV